MNPSTEPILDAANKFLWSDEMQESMDGFASNYGEMFVGVTRQQAAGRAEQKRGYCSGRPRRFRRTPCASS